MKRLFILLILLILSTTAHARMYQWVDPDTSTTQLSGKPPHWYRSDTDGPRVIVFENGKVIDDTGIELSEAESDRLRQQALVIVERDRIAALEKLRQAEMQRAAFDTEEDEEEVAPEIIMMPVQEVPEGEANGQAEIDEQEIEQQMRQLLEQYEMLKTRNARELVQPGGP